MVRVRVGVGVWTHGAVVAVQRGPPVQVLGHTGRGLGLGVCPRAHRMRVRVRLRVRLGLGLGCSLRFVLRLGGGRLSSSSHARLST